MQPRRRPPWEPQITAASPSPGQGEVERKELEKRNYQRGNLRESWSQMKGRAQSLEERSRSNCNEGKGQCGKGHLYNVALQLKSHFWPFQ